jgi:hypothetical protein
MRGCETLQAGVSAPKVFPVEKLGPSPYHPLTITVAPPMW